MIRTRAGSANAWLEVTYQGLAAPTDLFADLALIGWTPPTVAPPPHDAIDWSLPNEVTGERFTLRDYTVEGAVVGSPPGTGTRGAWTDPERNTHLGALGRVLDRHPDVAVEDPAGLVRAAGATAALPPPPPPLSTVPAPAPTPDPAGAAAAVEAVEGGFVPAPDANAILVTAPIKPSLAPEVEDELVALGVTVVFDSHERVREERYRGSTYHTTITELHVAAIVARDQLDQVVALLTARGLTLTYADVENAEVAPDQPEGMTPTPPRENGLAQVIAVADPWATDALREVIRTLGLVDVSLTRTTRTEVMSYRGSRAEREVPAIRVVIWVPEPDARLVADHIAEASRLRPDDADRLQILPPAPAPAAAVADVAEAVDPGRADPADLAPGPTPPAPPPPRPAPSAGPTLDPGALVPRSAPELLDQAR